MRIGAAVARRKPASIRIDSEFFVCSYRCMDRERISSILLSSPAWVRLGLTVPDSRMREQAADALAATIIDRLQDPAPVIHDRNQLALPI